MVHSAEGEGFKTSPASENPRTGDSTSETVCQNCRAAYAESVMVVLVPSVSTRYAESLDIYQYCVGE
jgi:hypothetical protein